MKRKLKMTNPEIKKSPRSLFGWAAVVGGILLFLVGLGLRMYLPGTIADTRLLEGLGILLVGWGVIPLINTLLSRRNPKAAHRRHLDENDERALSIRNQAAFSALIVSEAGSSLLLIVYSAMTRGQSGFDPLWLGLVGLVIIPIGVYAVEVNRLNRSQG
jgi:hypothetical protein